MKKASLLSHGVLRKDRSALDGAPLLSRDNVDDPSLLVLARTVASAVGLSESTRFAAMHPAKLFDFSTRARCLAPFKVLAVAPSNGGPADAAMTGATAERVVSYDLAAHRELSLPSNPALESTGTVARGHVSG